MTTTLSRIGIAAAFVAGFAAFATLAVTAQVKSNDNKFQCCIHPWMRATIRVE